jgi:hypothetical protein
MKSGASDEVTVVGIPGEYGVLAFENDYTDTMMAMRTITIDTKNIDPKLLQVALESE